MPAHDKDYINNLDQSLNGVTINNTPPTTILKPPIGITPRYIVMEKRLQEIDEAIMRYTETLNKFPIEWVEERNEIIGWLKNRKGNN